METYENRMREMGYQIVEISKLDTEAQLAQFADTTDIVGIHGVCMMNMIMMPPGGNYSVITGASVSFVPDRYCPVFTARCAMVAGHRVSGLVDNLDRRCRQIIDIE